MRFKLIGLLIAAASLSLVIAQEPTYRFTGGQPNGRWWTSLSDTQQHYFLFGCAAYGAFFRDSPIQAASGQKTFSNQKIQDWFPNALAMSEIQKSLNRFYDEPVNSNLPVLFALHLLQMKVSGKTQAEIDEETASMRRYAAELK